MEAHEIPLDRSFMLPDTELIEKTYEAMFQHFLKSFWETDMEEQPLENIQTIHLAFEKAAHEAVKHVTAIVFNPAEDAYFTWSKAELAH